MARERKQAAYSSATRALLRVRNRRRRMARTGESLIAKQELGTFLDDPVDAQHGLSMLLIACGQHQRAAVDDARTRLDSLVDDMLTPRRGESLQTVSDRLDEVWEIVVRAGGDDIGD